MSGDDQVRHCSMCDRKVYNLSAMTRQEALTLLQQHEGRICGRYYRRTDGTIMTRDCGRVEKIRVRTAVAMSSVVATVLGALGLVLALGQKPSVTMGQMAVPAKADRTPRQVKPVPALKSEPLSEMVGMIAPTPPSEPELRRMIGNLNKMIQNEKNGRTRREYVEERELFVDRLRVARDIPSDQS